MTHATRTIPLRTFPNLLWRSLALSAVASLLWGCPTQDKTQDKTPQARQEARDTEIEHESCDLTSSGARQQAVDAQGPVIISVMEGPHEACRAVDLNRDGVIDVFVYFDGIGKERRRESAFGRDGLPNEVAIYDGGVLVRKERETNNDARLDTWDYYEGGRLVREERDSTGDGYIDQWWTFNRPNNPECAVVLSDANGDGEPDKGSRIDMCADMVPAQKTPAKAAASAAKGDSSTKDGAAKDGTAKDGGDAAKDGGATPDSGATGDGTAKDGSDAAPQPAPAEGQP